MTEIKQLLVKARAKISAWTETQKIIALISIAVLVVGTATGTVYCAYQENQKSKAECKPGPIEIEVLQEEPVVEEPEILVRNISFSGTSIERDLKIKIVDEQGALVTGTPFVITVAASQGAVGQDYTDEDMDGMIHIQNIEAGNYVVQLHAMENFVIAESSITVAVKPKIEYKKVDVKAEIKKEEEINVKAEDTSKNEAVTQKPTETLPKVESTIAVPKDQVDTSQFPKAYCGETTCEEIIHETITLSLTDNIFLYKHGTEESKKLLLKLEVTGDDGAAVQGIEWSIADEGIVSITKNEDNTVILTALELGTTSLTATVKYVDSIAEVAQDKILTGTITVGDFTDEKTQLTNGEGHPLYLDAEAITKATLKDYGKAETFYMVKENAVEHGIDVSKWQQSIDWKAVKKAGVSFAIIRVGYRGSATGVLVEDPYFKEHIAGATAAGIKVGVYFFSQAVTEAEAVEEASMAISLVSGYKLSYPIFIDTEETPGGRANSLSKSARTKIVKAFCETVKNSGYLPGVYANKDYFTNKLNTSELEKYMIWIARYHKELGYSGKYDIWQYSQTGKVSGIKGSVDLNTRYF